MPVEVSCLNCSKRHSVAESVAGKSIRCKGCGQTFVAGGSATLKTARPVPARNNAPNIESVGRFVVRKKLGAGAFGTVYRAYDPQLDREVALKVPNPGVMSDAKRVERFLREAKAAANLRHPHIVPVFDAGRDGDVLYIASAFVDGNPLSEDIPERGAKFTRAARLVRELAEALAYAHEQGIVHRDVKPQNVMLDKQDRIHLMDFGLAARQDEAARLTSDGAVVGTPAYMAPEQAKGQKGEVKAAADQYAVGVVLYELLTGTVPFKGPVPVVLHNVVHAQPEPPRNHRANVPRDLETICLKALTKRPAGRYASCGDLADDLRRWLEGEPIAARRPGLAERATRWVKKEPKLALAAAALVAVLAVSFVFVSAAARRATAARRQAEEALARAEQGAEEARAAREREEQSVGTALGALGTAAEERRRAERFLDALTAEQKRTGTLAQELKIERERIAALQGAPVVGPKKPDAGPVPVKPVAVEKLATPQFKGHESAVISASFSPDGTRVLTLSTFSLTGGAGAARVWDAKTGIEQSVYRAPYAYAMLSSAAWSPDGTRVLTCGGGIWDAKTGAELPELKGFGGSGLRLFSKVAFSPDGSLMATTIPEQKTVRLWDVKTGKAVFTLNGHTASVRDIEWSADGTKLITAGADRTARVWDAKTGKSISTLKLTYGASGASLSPDGSRALTTEDDGDALLWDVDTGESKLACRARVIRARFSPDGSLFATAERDDVMRVRVWDVKTRDMVLTLSGQKGIVTDVAWSPDGTRIVTAGSDGTARVWDARPPKN